MKDETVQMWEEKLGDSKGWVGNCYAIARQAINEGIVDGIAVYGHWLGGAAPDSYFSYKTVPFIHHGWIRNKYVIVDPTRWVFFGNEPFIWFGPLDSPEYDEGGNLWLKMMERPCPAFDPTEKLIEADWPDPVYDLIGGSVGVTVSQAFWIGNLSLITLGELALPAYQALEQAGLKAAIPLDNWRKVMVHG